MGTYKLLALDMDGTMLSSSKHILPRTLQAIKAAAAGAVSKAGNVAQQVEERGTLAADALARERDRFAQSLRALRLSQMGTVAKSAARRAIGAVSPERLPDSPNREQLAGLWRDMLDKS